MRQLLIVVLYALVNVLIRITIACYGDYKTSMIHSAL